MQNNLLQKHITYKVEKLEELDQIVDFIKFNIKDTIYIIYLRGNLGAGKTTLASKLIKSLGSEEIINSPTFTYLKTYLVGNRTIYHYDLYRINELASKDEKLEILEQIGYQESLGDKTGLLLIEWPEKCHEVLPKPNMEISIIHNTNRTININY